MEALQVPFDASFPKLLEDRLQESGFKNIEVINASVSGWGTEDELAYLIRYGKQLKPDLILVAMTLHNDISDNMRQQFFTVKGGLLRANPVRATPMMEYAIIRLKSFIASHSHLFQLWRKYWYWSAIQSTGLQLKNHVKALLLGAGNPELERAWQLTFYEIAAIQNEAKAMGSESAVILIPLALQLSRPTRLLAISSAPERKASDREQEPQGSMIEFGKSRKLHIIDLLPRFEEWKSTHQTLLYLERDGHWSAAGHKLAANYVATELLRLGLLRTTNNIIAN
jgi:hypothetical protein